MNTVNVYRLYANNQMTTSDRKLMLIIILVAVAAIGALVLAEVLDPPRPSRDAVLAP